MMCLSSSSLTSTSRKPGPQQLNGVQFENCYPIERNLDADDDFMQTSSLDFEKIGGPRLEKVATFPKFRFRVA